MVFVEGTRGRPYWFGEGTERAWIEVPDFFIATVPVTEGLWAHVMVGGSGGRRPKTDVSWDELTGAGGFLQRANSRLAAEGGYGDAVFRLPTEAEWEYAARGGPRWGDDFRFSGSNDIDSVAWYERKGGDASHEVALKAPNQLGIYDMSGNVWEWCQDSFTRDIGSIPRDGSAAAGPADERVLRGGCFHNWAIHCTVSKRYEIGREFHDGCIGFRLALSAAAGCPG
jgi:sulfatase modifying factor 1